MKKIFTLAAVLVATSALTFASIGETPSCACCVNCECLDCICDAIGCDCLDGDCCFDGCCAAK